MGDKMNFKIIKKEIDKWDPINLLPHAPSDEYDIESREILSKFQYDIEQNGMVIYEVFSKAFGTTFTKNVNECINISKKNYEADDHSFGLNLSNVHTLENNVRYLT